MRHPRVWLVANGYKDIENRKVPRGKVDRGYNADL
jgi:hypothetical protein